MPSTFRPPVVYSLPRTLPTSAGPERRFFRRASALPVGQSVLKINGVYQTISNPTLLQCDAASEVYLGGHDYVVNDTIAAALTAAGYGAYLS